MSATWSVSVTVGNVRGNPVMKQAKVREDCDVLMSLARVAMAVEIKIPRYNRAFERAAHAAGKRPYFESSPNQIAVPAEWETMRRERRVLTKGAAFIPQPKREADILYDFDNMVAWVVVHMTNGAWNHKRKPFKKRRQRFWLRQERRIRRLVAELLAQGFSVVIGGDMNTGPMRQDVDFHDKQQVVVRAGLMQLIAIPASGVTITDNRNERVGGDDINTDHPFIRARLNFTLAA